MTNLQYAAYRSIWGALDLLFPPYCGGCGRGGSRWCEDCQKRVKILDGILCEVCGLPQDEPGVCGACRTERPRFRALRAWAVFDDPVQSALHKLKYRRDLSMGDALANQMLPFVKNLGWKIDLAIPIPLSRQRMKERGYNQVAMIANPLAMALGLAYAPGELTRQKATRSQVGLTREERRDNVHAAFKAGGRVKGRTVLILDDVSTTGATLSSAAEALYSAGAENVYALTVARALPHHGLRHV
ncbi:ComF family protein [Chloroflexi bacterium CFX2]|nr:ComF family protein [Chloroflexi bacterium CFX2]